MLFELLTSMKLDSDNPLEIVGEVVQTIAAIPATIFVDIVSIPFAIQGWLEELDKEQGKS